MPALTAAMMASGSSLLGLSEVTTTWSAARRVAQTESRLIGPLSVGGWFAAGGPFGVRRSALVSAPVVFLALIGSGMAARSVMDQQTAAQVIPAPPPRLTLVPRPDRKSTRLNSSHRCISYAV